ncbi:MAG TPA: ribonuclease PH [Acidimicrobiaceae bacterium]|nr:ribonuclease PH [Acidimicrobiaceae bacterium]
MNDAAPVSRPDGRAAAELRPITFERGFTQQTPGSVLVRFGDTAVLCTASVDDDVPRWMRDLSPARGWVTAEYSMLPGSSGERVRRESKAGKQKGRTLEIERLIARALRAVCDLEALGARELTVDCDVLQADGGTRTASICGGWVALHDACTNLLGAGVVERHPVTDVCAAVSVGVVDGAAVLDLPYAEDSRADVDMNVVMTGSGRFVEVQGTAEGEPFGDDQLEEMLGLARAGIAEIAELQRAAVAEPLSR